MAKNYVGSGRVITVTASGTTSSGQAIRVKGLNGVALIDATTGQPLTVQVEGIFTLTLASVDENDLIYIAAADNSLSTTSGAGKHLYGRALSSSDAANKFACRIQQNADAVA